MNNELVKIENNEIIVDKNFVEDFRNFKKLQLEMEGFVYENL